MVKISIIIPCYNLSSYINSCIEGISRQPVGKVEYIFINDGSTDDTLIQIEEFCKTKPYCKIINQPNAGVSSARNTGIKHAEGEYIYLLDGDDILTDNAISTMLDAIKDSDCDAVLSETIVLQNGSERKIPLPIADGLYTPEEIYKNVRVFPLMPQLLYRSDIIKKHNIRFDDNLKFGEVYEFTIHFFCYAKTVKVISKCFFKYVMRDNSATHIPNYSKDLSIIETLKKYKQIGKRFSSFPSFNLTAFKIVMSFTYNKYAKLGLKCSAAIENIKFLLDDNDIRNLIKEISRSTNIPIKDRLLAIYVHLSGVRGYKLLTKLF